MPSIFNLIERDPEWVADELAAALAHTLNVRAIGPATASRWKHGLASRTAGIPVAIDAQQQLLACGDWCLGPTAGHAIASGYAAGEAADKMVQELPDSMMSQT